MATFIKKLAGGLTPTVAALGFVSLLTDFSSEMIYPLLPVFLTATLGAGAFVLGLVEGVAESAAALLKLAGGIISDRAGKRKPFILAGYGLAGICRPAIGLAATWPWVLFLRFTDRVGKGIRTSPRDALIADSTSRENYGAAYGFHRSMDHLGAVLGPLAAALLLGYGLGMREVFLLAIVPSAAAMLVIFLFVKEKNRQPPPREQNTAEARGPMPQSAKRFFAAVTVFTLGNSTDAFILLKLSETGVVARDISLLWAAHHLIKMAGAFMGGRLSDRLGRKPLLFAGWLLYAAVYAGFATVAGKTATIILFLVYGIYYGLTEPAEKALVADLAPASARGRLFGWYNGAVGFAALPASLVFGFVWTSFTPGTAFVMGAVLALAASAMLLTVDAT